MRKSLWFALTALCLVATAIQASDSGGLQIDHAWARATAPGTTAAAAYLRIMNPAQGPADTLLGARTEIATGTELHSHREDKGMMQMRTLASVPIPPGQIVEMRPGKLHIMLSGLSKPLVAGQTFTLTLQFERAGNISVPVKVEALDFEPVGESHHHHH